MPWTLYYLIKASGNSGASGQSFRNHVAPFGTSGLPGSGTKMSDYKVFGWGSWTGEPDPEDPPYTSGHVFTIGWTFSEGSMASYIRRTGSSVIDITASSQGFGGSVSATSSVTTSSTGSASITIVSRYNPDAATTPVNQASAWFTGYTYPSTPTDTGEVTFQVGTDWGTGDGYELVDISMRYVIDTSSGGTDHFNDGEGGGQITHAINDIPMHDRAATNSDLDVQWSTDGSTNDYGTGLSVTWNQGHVGEDKTLYYRARLTGGTYSSWTALTFTDSRPEI